MVENKKDIRKHHGGPMGKGPGFAGVADKPKDFSKTLKRLIKYIGKYNKVILLVVFVLICSTILSTLSPKVLGKATTELGNNVIQKVGYSQIQGYLANLPEQVRNQIPEGATVQTLIDMNLISDDVAEKLPVIARDISLTVEPTINYNYIGKILLIILAMYFTSALFTYISTRSMAYIAQKVTYSLRKEIDEKLDRLPLKFFDKHTHGEILSRVTSDVDMVSSTLEQTIVQILQSVFTIIGILVMMISISLSMAGVAILIVPVSLIFISGIIKISQKYFIRQQKVIGELNGQVEETYSGNLVIHAFNMQDEEIKQFGKMNNELYRCGWKSQFLSGLMHPLMNFMGNIGYVAVAVAGGYLAINGTITVGNIQSFIQYNRQFNQPITQIAQISAMLQSMVAAAERIFEFLEEPEELETAKGNIDTSKLKGNIEFNHVNFGYNPEKTIINDFNCSVKEGQKIAIVGPTGAGKTTMVKLLMRFYDVNKGEILVDGHNIKDFNRGELRKMFGMVLQDTWLFGGTVKENIKYGREDATDDEVIQAAKAAHVHHFIKTLPNGYNSVLNEESTNVSAGQKQLLTIARVILADPKILILDEATSSIDTRTEIQIKDAMDNLMKGRTSFIIAHRLSTIKNADLILVMNHGDIVEQGNHEELLARNGFYADLYNSQFDEEEE